MKKLLYIGVILLVFIVPATAQNFTNSLSGLGTKREKTIVIDGMKIVFPVDEEDLIQLLLPVFKIHQDARQEHAAMVAKEMNETFPGLEPEFKKLIQKLLGIDEVSAGFSDAFEKELLKVQKISHQWIRWSGDMREIHLWNHATLEPFLNTDTREITFPEIQFLPDPDGSFNISLFPPFVGELGIGIGKLRPSIEKLEAFRLDIPLLGKPGKSAETVAEDLTKLLLVISQQQDRMGTQLATYLVFKEVIESLLRHEIEARYFAENTPESFTRGVARYYLLLHILLSERENFSQLMGPLFYFQPPDNGENTAMLLEKITKMNPLRTDDPELIDAAGRVIMMAVFMAAQDSDNDKALFVEFRKHGIVIPERGLNREEFVSALHKTYPNIEKHLSETKARLIEMVENESLEKGEQKKKPFVWPDDYIKRKISGLTLSFPRVLSEAVEKIGPEWAEKLAVARQEIKKRFDAPLVQPIKISKQDSLSLQQYGFTGSEEEMRLWATQAAVMANLGQLVVRVFDGNEIQIWFKQDLKSLIKLGVDVPDFTLNKEEDTVLYNFEFSYGASATVDDVVAAIDSVPSKFFPVVIKEAGKVVKGSIEEQIAAIRKGDVMVKQLTESADTITPEQLTGKTTRLLTDEQSFFVVVHGVVEADLLRDTIASDDRRWFCDGLANVIAIRECDRRFGKKVGMETFFSMFPEEESKRHLSKVNLLKWAAAEVENESVAEAEGLGAAYYHYATKALLEATKGRDTKFIANWISKINQTQWNRTNTETVIRAYDQLTGKDLRHLLIGATGPKL